MNRCLGAFRSTSDGCGKEWPSGREVALFIVCMVVSCVGWTPSETLHASSADPLLAVTDQMTYKVGDPVSLRFVPTPEAGSNALDSCIFTIRHENVGSESTLKCAWTRYRGAV